MIPFKSILFFVLCLMCTNTFSQDYNQIVRLLSYEYSADYIQQALTHLNSEHLGIQLIDKAREKTKLYEVVKSYSVNSRLKKLNEDFDRDYPNPENRDDCRRMRSLSKELKGQRVWIAADKALAEACQRMGGNCSESIRKYNAAVNEYRSKGYKHNEYQKTCNRYGDRYNRRLREVRNEQNEIRNKGRKILSDWRTSVSHFDEFKEKLKNQLKLADYYEDRKDYENAIYWYKKQHGENSVKTQFYAGTLYYRLKDYTKAIDWFERAAMQNNINAQLNAALLYEEKKDYTKAFHWYKKAAEQNNSSAQYNLGYAYSRGLGTNKDYTKAFHWYQKAAEQNNSDAQYKLGTMYYNGDGTEKNNKEAAYWFSKSSKNGNNKGKERLEDLDLWKYLK